MFQFLLGLLLLVSNFLLVSRALAETDAGSGPGDMTTPIRGRARCAALMLVLALLPAGANAQNAYIPNDGDDTVSVIDTATNTVTTTISVGHGPYGVAVTPDGTKAYVNNQTDGTVSVIDTATNRVTTTIPVGLTPFGVAITPDGIKAYVANGNDGTVLVIDTATNTVTTTISVGGGPFGVAITPDGTKAYVANAANTVSVIATATNTVVATVPSVPEGHGVAITPDGTKAYVANGAGNTVSVIDTATNTVIATIPVVGNFPEGVAVTPDGTRAYVANLGLRALSVIDTATNKVTTTIPVGRDPYGVAVTPDGTKAYVANLNDNTVSIIDTATDTVTTTIAVGHGPYAFGNFIGGPSHGSRPVAVNETKTTPANTAITIDLTAGATGKPTSAALVGTPIGGAVSGFPATTVTFTPTKDFTGTASFQFTLANAFGTSNTATATITVTPSPLAPVAVDETATTPAGVPVPIDLTAGATGKPTSAALVGTPVGGKVTGFPATTVTFTPTTGFTGAASFQFMLANAFGKSNTATTTITVKGPDPNFKLSASAYCNTSPPTGPAVKLGWTAQSGAASYDLYRNGQLYSQSIPQTSFDNNANVTAGNTYAYFVVAHASGREIESNVVSVLVPSGTCSAAALPNLVIQNLLLSGNSVAAGSNAQIKFTVHNKTPYTTVGAGSAAPSVTHIRLGKSSSKVTANDSLLLSLSTPASAAEADPNRGDSVEVAEQVTIPNNLAAGPYYLWVILDSTSSAGQGRANELDDKSALPITVTNPVVGPDLVVRNLALNHAKIAPGASITVSFSVANQGSNTANASSTKVYLSTSNSHIGPADLLLGSMTTPSVGPGLALPKTASTFTIPAQTPAGDYYAWVMLDANNSAGQPPVAKANDKAYVPLSLASDAAKAAGPMPLALAADAAPVPVRLVKAVQRTLHALKALAITGSPKLPDTLNTVKSLAGILIAAGEDLHFLNTKEDALASLEYLRSIDNDLNSEINALEQGVNAYRPTKLGALVAE